jgi:hypothetical protein
MTSSDTIHCPYCNASLPSSPEAAAPPRITCPSCGDSFSNKQATAHQTHAATPTTLPQPTEAPLTNAGIARILLILMGIMAICGLTFALYTVGFRRSNDITGVQPPGGLHAYTGEPTAPAKLPALGLLPAGSDIVAGIHVRDLLHTAEGKAGWDALKSGKTNDPLAKLEQWTGLKPEDIDHVVAGVYFKDLGPETYLIVRTLKPYSQKKISEVAKHTKPASFDNRPVYISQANFFANRLFWCKDDTTLVIYFRLLGIASVEEDLKAIPKQPKTGATALPPSLRDCVENRLDPGTVLWTVGETPKLNAAADLLSNITLRGEYKELLQQPLQESAEFRQKVQVFSVGLRPQNGIMVTGNFQGKDLEAARFLTQKFTDSIPGAKVIGPDEDADEENPGQRWVTVQIQVPTPWMAVGKKSDEK